MRKTPLVFLSTTIALIWALLSIEMGTTANADTTVPRTETEVSESPGPVPQNAHFIWVSSDGDQGQAGYHRVVGGKHRDGNEMYICRAFTVTPGKIYRNSCHYSFGGQEYVLPHSYEVLLTDGGYEWRSFYDLSRSEIKKSAVLGGVDPNNKDKLYVCRRQMVDGMHPGKYSYKNNLCYIPWGNGEKFYAKDFEILFPSQ